MTINSYLHLTFLLILIFLSLQTIAKNDMNCMDSERQALISFKYDLVDRGNILSSWNEENGDCCNWTGIRCSNTTGHIISLDLNGLDRFIDRLEGKIGSSLINLSRLIYLDLSYNHFDQIPLFEDIGSLVNLKYLNLSNNLLEGVIPLQLENLSKSSTFDLQCSHILNHTTYNSSACVLDSLEYLNLASNKFFGPLPNFTMLLSLKALDLSDNALNGTIPESIGQLSNLEYLYLDENSLEGEIYEAHFSKLTNLRALYLSGNSLILNLKSDWIPPFQLESIFLRSCNSGPSFPKWLQTQNFSSLDISDNKISDIVPHWFWNNLSQDVYFMDLSKNKIKGEIPNLSLRFKFGPNMINLNSNEFWGQVPSFLLRDVWFLDLSNNKFSSIACLCEVVDSMLSALDLSNNQLSSQLPDCWDRMPFLEFLYLANNSFSGAIPNSMGSLNQLYKLNLNKNKFSGELPHWLFNFTHLLVFDVMHNNLSGIIPSWFGSQLSNLVHLNLKANRFHGILPSSLCNLRNIEILDISSNNITGSIPTCIHNFTVLSGLHRLPQSASYKGDITYLDTFQSFPWSRYQWPSINLKDDMSLVWKGQDKIITGPPLQLQRGIDMSCNHLNGEIPSEITELVGLITLNLSSNNLTGQIPEKIGQLHSLESLDLSRNHLSGQIPPSFSQICALGVLNLSYNNLSGKIPLGTQLQTLPASSFGGNPYLCGAPLNNCSKADIQDQYINTNQDEPMTREWLISISLGFVVGFWGIFGSLVLHRKWRHVYFKFLNKIVNKVT